MDFDLAAGKFSFLDRAEVAKALSISAADATEYLVNLFVLSGALFNNRLSTTQNLTIEQIVEKLNDL